MDAPPPENYDEYYDRKLESGLEFQDYVVECCALYLKLTLTPYSSRRYQVAIGESMQGVEIKHDELFEKTGNLWIEMGEKKRPRPGPYAPSGIFRDDNAWLYLIGNRQMFFIFTKSRLVEMVPKYNRLENHTKTSVGFLLPHQDAWRNAEKIVTPHAETKVTHGLLLAQRQMPSMTPDPVVQAKPNGQMNLFDKPGPEYR